MTGLLLLKLKASFDVGGGAATGADEKSSKLKKSVGYDAGLYSGMLIAGEDCSSKPLPKLNISLGASDAYGPISNPSKAKFITSSCFFSSSFITGDFSICGLATIGSSLI